MLSSPQPRPATASQPNLTSNSSTNIVLVDAACEWLEKHQDTPIDELKATITSNKASSINDDDDPNAEPEALKEGEVAKSLVCEDCGKRFRSEAQAEFHASKSGHQNF